MKKTGQLCFLVSLAMVLVWESTGVAQPLSADPALIDTITIQPYTRIHSSLIKEASGLTKSRLWPNVFWTHNDSGDNARIFPINRKGELLKPDWMQNYEGIEIPDAVNVDWEAITTDDEGNLIIADFGNNSNSRRDLALYLIREPYPWETVTTRIYRQILFYYPEQKSFPAEDRNYDAEAVFWWNGFIYFLTKHRSDSFTSLYRIDPSSEEQVVAAKFMEQFNIEGRVTGADLDSTGTRLAVLTETSIWLFEKLPESSQFFGGKKYWLPLSIPQAEAVAFDGTNIIILNEYGELYRLTETLFQKRK